MIWKPRNRSPPPWTIWKVSPVRRGQNGSAVFLDYDGTLTPIVDTPDRAVITGRHAAGGDRNFPGIARWGSSAAGTLRMCRTKWGSTPSSMPGSHGFDISGPEGLQTEKTRLGRISSRPRQGGERAVPKLWHPSRACWWSENNSPLPSTTDCVAPGKVERVEEVVDEVAAGHPELRKAYGKKIFELQPDMDWHKGKALLTLLRAP